MRDEVLELEDLGVVIAGTRQAGGADRGEGRSQRVPMGWSGAQSALACLLRADAACTVERDNILSTRLSWSPPMHLSICRISKFVQCASLKSIDILPWTHAPHIPQALTSH
jgi:hypothetical protein